MWAFTATTAAYIHSTRSQHSIATARRMPASCQQPDVALGCASGPEPVLVAFAAAPQVARPSGPFGPFSNQQHAPAIYLVEVEMVGLALNVAPAGDRFEHVC